MERLLAAINLIPIIVGVLIFAVWMHALVNWDGSTCDDDQCETCPFPCDKHDKHKGGTS